MALDGELGRRRGTRNEAAYTVAPRSKCDGCSGMGYANGRRCRLQARAGSSDGGLMAPRGTCCGSKVAPHYSAQGYAWGRDPIPDFDSVCDISCSSGLYPGSMRTQVRAPSHHHIADRPIELDQTAAGWMEGGVVAEGEEEECQDFGRDAGLLHRLARGRGHRSQPRGCGIRHCFSIDHCRGMHVVSSDGPIGPTMHSGTATADGAASRCHPVMGRATCGDAWLYHMDKSRRGLHTRFDGAARNRGLPTATVRSWRATPAYRMDLSVPTHKAASLRVRWKGQLLHRPGVGILPKGYERIRNEGAGGCQGRGEGDAAPSRGRRYETCFDDKLCGNVYFGNGHLECDIKDRRGRRCGSCSPNTVCANVYTVDEDVQQKRRRTADEELHGRRSGTTGCVMLCVNVNCAVLIGANGKQRGRRHGFRFFYRLCMVADTFEGKDAVGEREVEDEWRKGDIEGGGWRGDGGGRESDEEDWGSWQAGGGSRRRERARGTTNAGGTNDRHLGHSHNGYMLQASEDANIDARALSHRRPTVVRFVMDGSVAPYSPAGRHRGGMTMRRPPGGGQRQSTSVEGEAEEACRMMQPKRRRDWAGRGRFRHMMKGSGVGERRDPLWPSGGALKGGKGSVGPDGETEPQEGHDRAGSCVGGSDWGTGGAAAWIGSGGADASGVGQRLRSAKDSRVALMTPRPTRNRIQTGRRRSRAHCRRRQGCEGCRRHGQWRLHEGNGGERRELGTKAERAHRGTRGGAAGAEKSKSRHRRRGKAYIRVGEATNPGPAVGETPTVRCGAAEYRNPAQEGFRQAVLPQPGGARAPQDKSHYELIIDTINATAWGPLSRYMLVTKADLLLCQELHLGPSEVPAASSYALRNGWQPVILPAAPGQGGGWRGGVAIFARRVLGLTPPRVGPYEVIPARAAAAVIEAPGYRPFTAIAAYLEHGKGLDDDNMAHLQEIGIFAEAQGEGMPFVIGADFQVDPSDMARMGFARKTNSSLVAARDPRGTCRSPISVSEIDYFFIHNSMSAGISEVAVVEGAGTAPHTPVRVKFHPRMTTARALTLRRPQTLGVERIVGPIPHINGWDEVTARSRALLGRIRRQDFVDDEDFKMDYADLFRDWADMAEQEIIEATGGRAELRKEGLRGRPPDLVWRAVQAERPPKPPARQMVLAKWRTMLTIHQEIRGVLQWMMPSALDTDGAESSGRGAARWPVPQHMRHDVMPNLEDKLRGIREQLASESAEDDDDGTFDDEALTDGANGEDVLKYRECRLRLHAMVCGAEIVLAEVRTTWRSQDAAAPRPQLLDRLVGRAEDLNDQLQRRLKLAAADERAARLDSWKQWISANITCGARNAHRYLKLPAEWRPTTTLTVDGVVTADPRALLASYAAKYDDLWNKAARERERRRTELQSAQARLGAKIGGGRPEPPWRKGKATPLWRPEPGELRTIARTFRKDTVVAFDGVALRHYDMMSDEALGVVADIMEVMETVGALPSQLRLTEMPLLEKPRGGHRAVASLVSLYRLWAKLRKPVVTEWEVRNDRPFLAAGKGRDPQSSVWRQACRAEAAVAEGRHSGTLLWDLATFFESVKREPLWHRARRLEFPLTILRLVLETYSAPRVLALGGAVTAPLEAEDGLVAGCTFAMALTRAYVTEPMDAAVYQLRPLSPSPANVDMYVDDLALEAEGTMREVVDRLTNAASVLRHVIEDQLECRIELSKASVISSSSALTDMLRNRFGDLAGPPPSGYQGRASGRRMHAVCGGRRRKVRWGGKDKGKTQPAVLNLGVDYAAGQPRRSHGKNCKRKKRLSTMRIKTGKLQKIRAIAGRRTSLIFMAGPLPEATYGAAVNGLSDAEVLAIRRCAAQAYTPRARGRSLSRLLLIEGVPTWRAEVEVILEYSRQVWRSSLLGAETAADGTLTLAQISRLWHAVSSEGLVSADGGRRNWAAVRGPIGAARLSLHRVGWSMKGPFTLVDHDGEDIKLTVTTPAMLAVMLKRAVTRTLQAQVGKKLAAGDPRFQGRRAAAEHITSQLRGDRKLSGRDRACYMSVACGAVMTYARAAAAGYLVDNRCPLCGIRGDTMVHRIWRCQHPEAAAAREATVPRWLLQEFSRAEDPERNAMWTTGMIPHPADVWPLPARDATMYYEWTGGGQPEGDDRGPGGEPRLKGGLYIDGSCTTGVFPELRRAAIAVVQWSPQVPAGWRMQLPVPHPMPQTPQAAEYGALALVNLYSHPEAGITVASDCANVVRDACQPPRMALSGRRVYAGVLKGALSDPSWVRRVQVRKVPAHVNPTSLPEGQQRDDAVGNDLADKLANEARAGHPKPTPAMEQELEAALKRARLVVRAIAKVSQCFPPMPRDRMVRPPPAREGARVAMGAGHRWVFASGMWRCEACLKMTLRPNIDGRLAHEKCPGARPSMDAAALTARGHTLAKTSGVMPIIFCVRCGAWSTRRAYGLATECRGRPAPAGRQALTRIARGQQPWEGRREEDGGGRRRGLRCAQMWSTDAASFISEATNGRGAKRGRSAGGNHQGEGGAETRACDDDRRSFADGDYLPEFHDAGQLGDAGVLQHGCGDEPMSDEDVFGHGGALDQEELHESRRAHGVEVDSGRAGSSDDGAQRRVRPRVKGNLRQAELGDASSPMGGHGSAFDAERGTGGGTMNTGCIEGQGRAGDERKDVEARGANKSVVAARVGPGDSEPSSITETAAVVTAAVSVELGEDATIPQGFGDDAPQHHAGGGEVASPPDGSAAPSDDVETGAIGPHGRELNSTPTERPDVVGGGGPPWREDKSLQVMPRRRSAGLRELGDAEISARRDTPPTRGVVRRRDGSDDPLVRLLVARRGTAATEEREEEQPQGGWSDRTSSGARHDGCRISAHQGSGEVSVVSGGRASAGGASSCKKRSAVTGQETDETSLVRKSVAASTRQEGGPFPTRDARGDERQGGDAPGGESDVEAESRQHTGDRIYVESRRGQVAAASTFEAVPKGGEVFVEGDAERSRGVATGDDDERRGQHEHRRDDQGKTAQGAAAQGLLLRHRRGDEHGDSHDANENSSRRYGGRSGQVHGTFLGDVVPGGAQAHQGRAAQGDVEAVAVAHERGRGDEQGQQLDGDPRGPLVQGCVRDGARREHGGWHRRLHDSAGARVGGPEFQGSLGAGPQRQRAVDEGGEAAGQGKKRGLQYRRAQEDLRRRRLHSPGAEHIGGGPTSGGGQDRLRSGERIGPPSPAISDWVMPWERRPQWEYLPHLDYHTESGEHDTGAGGENENSFRGGAVDTSGRGREEAHVTRGEGASGASRQMGFDSRQGIGAAGSMHVEQLAVGGASGGGTADKIRGRDHSPGAQLRAPAANAGFAEDDIIRGQGSLPGEPVDGGSAADDYGGVRHRGETRRHGRTADVGIGDAQERLDQQNAAFARSFADHAERVAKKARTTEQRENVSAAERLAALRRRVQHRLRAEHGGGDDRGSVRLERSRSQMTVGDRAPSTDGDFVPVESSGIGDRGCLTEGQWTIEVPKIQFTHSTGSVQGLSGQRHDGGDQSVGGVDSVEPAGICRRGAAEEAAASMAAWHTVAE